MYPFIFILGIGRSIYKQANWISIVDIVIKLAWTSFLSAWSIPDKVWFKEVNKGNKNIDFKYIPADLFLNTNKHNLSPKK